MYQVKEVNFLTGESIERDFNEDELIQRSKDSLEVEKQEKIKAEKIEKRQAALVKLVALGLEPDDLKALGF